jgi:hypothetical protein
MFWLAYILVLGGLVLLFANTLRQHPLPTLLLLAFVAYFLWRVHSFFLSDSKDDPLVWKILGVTIGAMVVAAGIGKLVVRRLMRK